VRARIKFDIFPVFAKPAFFFNYFRWGDDFGDSAQIAIIGAWRNGQPDVAARALARMVQDCGRFR